MDCPQGESGRGTRFEVSTNSRDASLQLVFADPYASLSQLGLAVPSRVPNFYPQVYANRYLALLVSVKFNEGDVARLVGMRQRALIGQLVGRYPVYQAITTPDWHFVDGNISWHLRRVDLKSGYQPNTFNSAEMSFRGSDTPSILFENAPAQVNGYGPPDGGRPPGNVVIPEFGNFHDLRFPWVDDHAWESLDIEIQGPCAINFYASIQQTDPQTRLNLDISGLGPDAINTLLPEERFLQDFPNAVYTRVAGSLIFEDVNFYPEPGKIVACGPTVPGPNPPRIPPKAQPPRLPGKGGDR